MGQENKIDRTDKIDNRTGRTCQSKRPVAQRGENIVHVEHSRSQDARVMPPKGMQLMRV